MAFGRYDIREGEFLYIRVFFSGSYVELDWGREKFCFRYEQGQPINFDMSLLFLFRL